MSGEKVPQFRFPVFVGGESVSGEKVPQFRFPVFVGGLCVAHACLLGID